MNATFKTYAVISILLGVLWGSCYMALSYANPAAFPMALTGVVGVVVTGIVFVTLCVVRTSSSER